MFWFSCFPLKIEDSDGAPIRAVAWFERFNVFGGADVRVHFKKLDPNNVVNYVYNIASYQFENDFPIQSGETIDSMDQNGDMQMTPQWRSQYEDSLIGPKRVVLDINCGEYAGGDRE